MDDATRGTVATKSTTAIYYRHEIPCKSLYEKGNNLVLLGNFNESIGVNPLGMASVMTTGHLTDAFCHRHD
jgi:hypothetical protein